MRPNYTESVLTMNDDDAVWEVSEGEESANEAKNEPGRNNEPHCRSR